MERRAYWRCPGALLHVIALMSIGANRLIVSLRPFKRRYGESHTMMLAI